MFRRVEGEQRVEAEGGAEETPRRGVADLREVLQEKRKDKEQRQDLRQVLDRKKREEEDVLELDWEEEDLLGGTEDLGIDLEEFQVMLQNQGMSPVSAPVGPPGARVAGETSPPRRGRPPVFEGKKDDRQGRGSPQGMPGPSQGRRRDGGASVTRTFVCGDRAQDQPGRGGALRTPARGAVAGVKEQEEQATPTQQVGRGSATRRPAQDAGVRATRPPEPPGAAEAAAGPQPPRGKTPSSAERIRKRAERRKRLRQKAQEANRPLTLNAEARRREARRALHFEKEKEDETDEEVAPTVRSTIQRPQRTRRLPLRFQK
ncbi:RNA-directed RNA polymerase VP2 [Frankliniella fusca]|uniref:RNA-directed RNA polymerase VP2 n=1 Tax=Frankliniella fusca TaxID=407009 RepID=A0AAE1HQ51_9NEOP|nr:RNA-directed RNA polymerase VP2 [Frankliniella fusca]